jgi:uncharacterized protein with ATP-grasp and redox domains
LKTYLECIPCFLRQALDVAKKVTNNEDTQREVLNSVSSIIPTLSLDLRPPEIAQTVYRIIARITGNEDPYQEAKQQANRLTLTLYPYFKKLVANAKDPLLAASKLAIAGNVIDLATDSHYGDIKSIAEQALDSPLGLDDYEEFRESIGYSSRLLYLGDNTGEIVFDRILIEEIRRIRDLEIYFAVRDKPIINDATLFDAIYIGMNNVAEVISNGSDAPATILSQCSSQMLKLYHSADTVIAKGQGNYESLSDEAKNIFFLLRVKCPVVERLLKTKMGEAILKKQVV